MWVLLARYDQVELEVQSAYSKQENSSTRSRISRTGTHDSRGIGYADLNGNPWANLNYTGVQGAQSALSTALQFFSMDERIDGFVTTTLKALQKMIPGPEHNNLPPELLGMLHLSKLIDKVAELLRNDSLEDITSRKEIYKAALQFVKKLGSHSELISLVQTPRHHKQQSPGLESLTVHANWKVKREDQQLLLGDKIPSVAERLLQLAKQSDIVLSAPEKEMLARESGQSMLDLCREVSEVYALIGATGSNSRQNKETQKIDEYQIFHQKNCLTRDDRILTARHAFMGMAMQMTQSPPGRMKRLIAELANMATSLPVGIYVKVSECRPDIMRCLVMGPPDSPYGYGLFE